MESCDRCEEVCKALSYQTLVTDEPCDFGAGLCIECRVGWLNVVEVEPCWVRYYEIEDLLRSGACNGETTYMLLREQRSLLRACWQVAIEYVTPSDESSSDIRSEV